MSSGPSIRELPRARSDIEPDLKIGFILSPKFSILPFACFIDCLRHAADEADRSRQIHCGWSVIAPTLHPVEASCGVQVTPVEKFPDPTDFDYVVVVGGLLPACLDQAPETYAYLSDAYMNNVSIVGLCTGSFVLAKAGLLEARQCAVHFEHSQRMTELFPGAIPVTDRVYINDQGIITCPGGTAAIDLAAALIEQHCGKARALKGLVSLLVDQHRPSHHIPYRPYENLTACGDWRVEQSVQLMEQHISRPFGIDQLARRLGSSRRELNRAFARSAGPSPAVVWRKMRLSHGQWLLLNTHRTVTRVAYECGFADAAHFSRWFKREYGNAPRTFRRQRQNLQGSLD